MSEPVLALEVLYENVRARLGEEQPGTVVAFGWRERAKQVNQGTGRANRVIFEPGDAGKAGGYSGAKRPGRNPRPLGTLTETCTVYCWACDAESAEAANQELAQWRAARMLHDAVYRAIQLALRTKAEANLNVKFDAPEWVLTNVERPFGAEMKFRLTLDAMIPDEAYEERDDVQYSEGAFLNEELDGTTVTEGEVP